MMTINDDDDDDVQKEEGLFGSSHNIIICISVWEKNIVQPCAYFYGYDGYNISYRYYKLGTRGTRMRLYAVPCMHSKRLRALYAA